MLQKFFYTIQLHMSYIFINDEDSCMQCNCNINMPIIVLNQLEGELNGFAREYLLLNIIWGSNSSGQVGI